MEGISVSHTVPVLPTVHKRFLIYSCTMSLWSINVLNTSLGIKSCFFTQMNEWNQLDDDDDTHDLSDVSLAQVFRVKVYLCL